MSSTAKNISRYIINFFHESGDLITNLKMQKLLYYVQGWHLALTDKPLFKENFQAWVHGPVIQDVYSEYQDFKWNPITADCRSPTLDKDTKDIIDEVLRVYGVESAYALELRTHTEMPWKRARGNKQPDEISQAIIKKEWIKEFFDGLKDGEKQ